MLCFVQISESSLDYWLSKELIYDVYSLVRDYVLYIIISKLIYSYSADKDGILYNAIEYSVIYKLMKSLIG